MAKRQAGMARARRGRGQDPGRSAHYEKVENWDGVALVPEALGDPLKWRKARRVFVCSMSDLFHEDVSDEFILRVFRVMGSGQCRHHTFQLLTKRPRRMKKWIDEYVVDWDNNPLPFPNIWLGVTAEDQQRADERIPVLLRTPAAVRFVSAEPLLGPIDFAAFRGLPVYLNQIIVGAETGPGKRLMKMDWARDIRNSCIQWGTSFFFKKDSAGERTIDGVKWEQMPR